MLWTMVEPPTRDTDFKLVNYAISIPAENIGQSIDTDNSATISVSQVNQQKRKKNQRNPQLPI